MKSLRLRLFITLLVLVFALAYALPNIPAISNSALGKLLPDARINLGLDLKGGMSLTLGVELDKAVEKTLSTLGMGIREQAAEEDLLVLRSRLSTTGDLELVVPKKESIEPIKALIQDYYSDLEFLGESVSGTNTLLVYNLTYAARQALETITMDQVVRTIRNRIDQFGVTEPDIRRQADNQVQVQLPGLTDPDRAVQIIGQTAHLEFRLVRDDINPSIMTLPFDVERVPMADNSSQYLILDKNVLMTGETIVDARPSFNERGEPYVGLSFDPQGAKVFANVTGEYKDSRLAIVLDGYIHSAPVINQKITGGDASISGNFSLEEAQDLSVILRAGSLPAPVVILEERLVGPSLGQESIDSGILAAFVGAVAVLLIMPIFYGMSGVIADIMLCFTLTILFAGLSAFGATLTLPGIAGVVLTIGMAVDASVLIFERLREELKKGSQSSRDVVKAAFDRASISIIDSNLTTIIAAVILYQFGTGPVKGFAITLVLGIFASMFTAVFVSRMIFEYWIKDAQKRISV